jgi:hypothetical protein
MTGPHPHADDSRLASISFCHAGFSIQVLALHPTLERAALSTTHRAAVPVSRVQQWGAADSMTHPMQQWQVVIRGIRGGPLAIALEPIADEKEDTSAFMSGASSFPLRLFASHR